jgi:N-acetylmuramoyl-L-alanine amidase
LYQTYKQYLPLVLGLTAVCMSTQAVNAKVALSLPLQDSSLKAQLTPSINNLSNLSVRGSSVANNNLPTTIDGLSFNGYGQLVIQASRAINYRTSLDLATNTYNVTIPATKISSQLRRPILGSNSPIEQIRLNQVGDAVVVSVKAIAGWQIRETARTNPQAIALQLESIGQVATSNPLKPRSQIQPYSNNTGRQLVVIDPGHGGPDVGATRNGVYEKDITLSMSRYLGRILQQMGYAVVYTRTEDIDLDLEPRVQIAENSRASAFVSVHVNSLDANASQVNGVETYYAPGASLGENLAELVHEQIIASTSATDRGVRSARFHVIVKTSMPAILVETGFITNPSEAARLVNSSYQERIADAIAKGIDQFLRSYRR